MDFFYYSLEIYMMEIVIFCLLFFLYVVLEKVFFNFNLLRNFLLLNFVILFLFVCFILFFFSFHFFFNKYFIFLFQLYQDDFILLIKIFVIFMSFFFFFFLFFYSKYENILLSFENCVLILLSILSMFVLISSSELILLYLSLEMQSLAFYVLASSKQNSILSIEAGLKYFVLGTIASGFLLLGSSLFYGYTGLTKFFEINLFFFFSSLESYLFFYFFIFFIVPFFFKFSAAPFHVWVPDVYDGSPTLITFFFSVIPKYIILGLFIRFFFDFVILNLFETNWKFLFFFSSILSLLIGSLGGIFQFKIKRLLAYSSITNVGFFLSSVFTLNFDGFLASLFYFFVYFFSTTGIFLVLVSVRYFDNFFKLKNIFEYSSLLNLNFFIVFSLVLNLFSLIGIPPLSGFFGKFFIFFSVLNKNYLVLLLILILASVISGFFYLRVIRILLFKRFLGFIFLIPLTATIAYFLSIIVFVNIFLLFYIDVIFKFSYFLFYLSF